MSPAPVEIGESPAGVKWVAYRPGHVPIMRQRLRALWARHLAKFREGEQVEYFTSGAWRRVTVLRTTKYGAKTVLVSGFKYLTRPYDAKPRRVPAGDVRRRFLPEVAR